MHNRKLTKEEVSIENQGYSYLRARESQQARKCFLQLPQAISTKLAIVRTYQMEGNYNQAKEILNNLLKKEKEMEEIVTSEIYLAYAYLYKDMKEYNSQKKMLEKMPNQDTFINGLLGWAKYYLAERDFNMAREYCNRLSKIAGRDHLQKVDRCLNEANGHDLLTSLSLLEKELKTKEEVHIYPTYNLICHAIKLLNKKHKDYKEHLNTLKSYVSLLSEQCDNHEYGLLAKALLNEHEGHEDKARIKYEVLLTRFPYSNDIKLKYAHFLYNYSGAQEALPYFKGLIKDDNHGFDNRGKAIIYTFIANCHLDIGHIKQTGESAQKAIKAYNRHAPAFSTLGKYYRSIGDESKAQQAFAKAYELDPIRFEKLHPYFEAEKIKPVATDNDNFQVHLTSQQSSTGSITFTLKSFDNAQKSATQSSAKTQDINKDVLDEQGFKTVIGNKSKINRNKAIKAAALNKFLNKPSKKPINKTEKTIDVTESNNKNKKKTRVVKQLPKKRNNANSKEEKPDMCTRVTQTFSNLYQQSELWYDRKAEEWANQLIATANELPKAFHQIKTYATNYTTDLYDRAKSVDSRNVLMFTKSCLPGSIGHDIYAEPQEDENITSPITEMPLTKEDEQSIVDMCKIYKATW